MLSAKLIYLCGLIFLGLVLAVININICVEEVGWSHTALSVVFLQCVYTSSFIIPFLTK
jgi:hypothetical protein